MGQGSIAPPALHQLRQEQASNDERGEPDPRQCRSAFGLRRHRRTARPNGAQRLVEIGKKWKKVQ